VLAALPDDDELPDEIELGAALKEDDELAGLAVLPDDAALPVEVELAGAE